MASETRTVGERGQVTIPKELRERLGIMGGDEVVVREEDGRVIIEQMTVRERLAEGYRARAGRDSQLEREMADVSAEADDDLGDAPEW
ncbi:AbrB/MazE/SpoVT family DNA-binding domain-containing protein [Halapricum salinum]|uniref:AbrB/MazE/SpoVT family DNA-binding domain-containing protein n=1 Tax=Halapricum salinum TaxID=1457250 RepID=A0A4D6HIQ1_9EURY|nr:AbrB/MazE/SpoVT family DNA-binding domain-containing protein [Halapricum salinum]QCC52577.1 AbrB/MazE/SpoVT family DNA-binding domain-containing protein [Halapricum salinum]